MKQNAPQDNAVSSPSVVSLDIRVGEQVKWWVVSGGGGTSTTSGYRLSHTIGQTAAGPISSASYRLSQGFWQSTSSGSCCLGVVGNADGDAGDAVDISDLQIYIDYLFFSGGPASCLEEFDAAGGDGVVDISDLQVIVDYLFFGGSLPACP